MTLHLSATLLAILGVLGALAPHAVAWINRCHWVTWVKGLVAVAVSVVIGIATLAVAGKLDGESIAVAITEVYAASQLAYATFFRRSSDAVEAATTPAAAADPGDGMSAM